LIGLLTVLGILAGLAYTQLRTAVWEDTATLFVRPSPTNITVTSDSLRGNIDPTVNSVLVPEINVRSLVFLGRNPTVADRVIRDLGDELPADLRRPASLLKCVSVEEAPGRPNTLFVRATVPRNGELATKLANSWARLGAEYINNQLAPGYANTGEAINAQRAVERERAQAQAAVTAFEGESAIPRISSQLAGAQSLLNLYTRQANQVRLNLENAALLRRGLARGQGNESTNLALLAISLSTYTTQAADVDVPDLLNQSRRTGQEDDAQPHTGQRDQVDPVLLQPTLERLSALTPKQQLGFLDSLVAALTAKQRDLEQRLTDTRGLVGRLSAELERANDEYNRLIVVRNASRQTYEDLRQLLTQQKVGVQIRSEKVSVVNPAIEAERTGLRGLLPPLMGGLAGGLLGTLASFLLEFARRPRRYARSTSAKSAG
jgi:hypothetical protein